MTAIKVEALSAIQMLSNNKQAIQYFDKALAIDPNNKYALYDNGMLLITWVY